jgi:ATP:cob(I)alamin adenosyltransferase
VITTKKGDLGFTSSLFNSQLSKTSWQVQAIGACDNLVVGLGYVRLNETSAGRAGIAKKLQEELNLVMGVLSAHSTEKKKLLESRFNYVPDLKRIESTISMLEEKVEYQKGWHMAGDHAVSMHWEEARVRCRHAETMILIAMREMYVWSDHTHPLKAVAVYFNRLSDMFWLLARAAADNVEVGWHTGYVISGNCTVLLDGCKCSECETPLTSSYWIRDLDRKPLCLKCSASYDLL